MTNREAIGADARFWSEESNGGRSVTWYWTDDACEEPMGPFESEADAVDDYNALRAPFSDQIIGSDEDETK